MKSKIKVAEVNREIVFPCLMIWENTDMIVLFTANKTGVIVHRGCGMWKLGKYSETWADCNSKEWQLFKGSITLEN